jgi:nucleotide-binding universal stress UspA family protein
MPTQTNLAPSSPTKASAVTKFCVVVGLDFSDADGPAFDQAARLAMHVPGSVLHLVHVFHTAPSPEKSRDLASHLRLYVNEKAAAANGLRGISVGIHIRGGVAVNQLVQLAADVQADIIVVGSHKGPHVKNWLDGSTVERLVSGATFPVLVASNKVPAVAKDDMTIEPACPECLKTRAAPGSTQWWCERHSHVAKAGHTVSYQRDIPLSDHDSEVIPTGIDF